MPFYRSVSQFSGYAKCGTAYEEQRVKKAPQRQAAWTFQGTAVHAALLKDDDGHGWESSGRTMSVHESQRKFSKVWSTELAKAKEIEPDLTRWFRGGTMKTSTDLEKRYALGLKQVEQYIDYASNENFRPIKLNGELTVEVKFEWNIGPNPYMVGAEDADEDIIVVGFIDVLGEDSNGTGKVRDLKTGNEPVWPFQLQSYGYAVEDCMGLLVDWGDYYLCKQEGPGSPKDITLTPKENVIRYFQKLDEGVRRKIFLPSRSADNCKFCSVQDSCPVFF